jgi:hypothetical protein
MACEDAISGLEARVEQRYDELKKLRGVVSKMVKDAPKESTPAPGEPEHSTPEKVPLPPETSHLAKRFRVF